MELELFYKLRKGDWVETVMGVGIIVHFGRWNGRKWIRSSRKKANGAYIYFDDKSEGYVDRTLIKRYLPPPPFGYIYKWEGDGKIITIKEKL